jgi:hypothetical protein
VKAYPIANTDAVSRYDSDFTSPVFTNSTRSGKRGIIIMQTIAKNQTLSRLPNRARAAEDGDVGAATVGVAKVGAATVGAATVGAEMVGAEMVGRGVAAIAHPDLEIG